MAEPSIEEILKAIEKASKDNPAAFKRLQTALQVKVQEGTDRANREGNIDEILKKEQSRLEVLTQSAKLTSDQVEASKQEAELLKTKLELALRREGLDKKELDGLLARIDAGKEMDGYADKYEKSTLEIIKQYNKLVPLQEEVNKLSHEHKRNISDIVDGMGSIVGLSDKYSKSFVGKMTKTFELFGKDTDEAKAAIKDFQDKFSTMFSMKNIAMNIGSAIFSQSMKTLRAFDDASANLAKTTGTVGKFNNVLYDAQRAGNLLGVSMADVGTAIAALNAGTSNFAKLNESTQTQLAISTSQFEKLGVSAQDTAEFMENAFKIMNMGATEAVEVQKELAMAGVQLGIGADKIVKDFNAASKTLAVYGKGSVKIFKDLAAQAKAAGVETSTLLGIVQKFDTFSGAAEGAAQFNALLGTQLSTTQMLMMTEDERMKTLVESVQAQGVAFGDMDRFTQKSIAAAAGITDMNEANRIFSMSLSDYEANAREMENNAAAQAKFDEAVQATVPTMNKFKNLATEMITLVQPALETLGEVADYLTDFFQGLSKETKETVSMIALFVAGVLTIAPLFAVGGGFMAGLAAVGPAIAGVGTGIATAIGAISAVTMTGVGAGVLAALVVAGGGIAMTMAAMAESEASMAESNAKMMSQGSDTIQSMAEIGRADFSGIATKFKGVVDELNSMGTDVKVTSMLQNLSLISAGTAIDITGAKIAGSSTNINTTVKNMFEGATINLKAGGRVFEGYVEEIAANVQMSNGKTT
jgi:hypothetical protein